MSAASSLRARASNGVRCHLLALEPLVDPGHEEEIAGAGLDGARAGEEEVRESVANGAQAELVPGVPLPELVDQVEGGTAVVLGVVQPGEGGRRGDGGWHGMAAGLSGLPNLRATYRIRH